MHKKYLINKKPAYFRGQLLLEGDFMAEQHYHASARYRHSLNLHGWGIVRGLDVRHAGGNEIAVSPGFAIDGHGHEIDLPHEEKLDLPANAANAALFVSLVYEEDADPAGGDDERRTRKCYAVLSATPGVVDGAVILATVELDDKSRITPEGIKTTNRRELKTLLTPGSVTAKALDAHLRTGWLRMPFRPTPLSPDKKEPEPPPPFRVGATESRSHSEIDGQRNTRGAAGTMAISLAPSVTRLLRLRVAGEQNESKLTVELYIGGWDAEKSKHIARRVLHEEVKGGPYDKVWDIAGGELHKETSTLSVEIRCDGYARVSLVAIEVTCDPALAQGVASIG